MQQHMKVISVSLLPLFNFKIFPVKLLMLKVLPYLKVNKAPYLQMDVDALKFNANNIFILCSMLISDLEDLESICKCINSHCS